MRSFTKFTAGGFHDSDGDGVGDFRGLTAKLDYLEWLGIECIWLLPFYESPLKDGGYDISDYYAILPEHGSFDDFKEFLAATHGIGMRVIADLVVNHTSDAIHGFRSRDGRQIHRNSPFRF